MLQENVTVALHCVTFVTVQRDITNHSLCRSNPCHDSAEDYTLRY